MKRMEFTLPKEIQEKLKKFTVSNNELKEAACNEIDIRLDILHQLNTEGFSEEECNAIKTQAKDSDISTISHILNEIMAIHHIAIQIFEEKKRILLLQHKEELLDLLSEQTSDVIKNMIDTIQNKQTFH